MRPDWEVVRRGSSSLADLPVNALDPIGETSQGCPGVIMSFGIRPGEEIGSSRVLISASLPCQCVFPLLSLLLSHVLSSRLRTWKGPHSRRIPRPRPRLLRRRRLDLLSLLYCHNSGQHKSHRRQITTVHQCHLVICLVYF
jgi:hypothetical protein